MPELKLIALEEGYLPPGLGLPPRLNSERLRFLNERMRDIEEYRLPDMDRTGVDVHVLSTGPGLQREPDAAVAVRRATEYNDDLADVVAKHPDRFAAFAALPCQDPEAAAKELERCVRELGFKGALVNGHTNGEYLDDEKFLVIWERAEALGVPIYLHPSWPPEEPHCVRHYDELQGAAWGWAFETGSHALRLVACGLFDRFPGTRLIIGHMGEGIPFTLWRLDDRWATYERQRPLQKRPSEYVRENFWITTSGVSSPEPLRCTIDALGADRVMFAVDYPHQDQQEAADFIRQTPLDESDRHLIAHTNAERLLGL